MACRVMLGHGMFKLETRNNIAVSRAPPARVVSAAKVRGQTFLLDPCLYHVIEESSLALRRGPPRRIRSKMCPCPSWRAAVPLQ
eukprot:2744373-Pyramimonas_sp.AAC.1